MDMDKKIKLRLNILLLAGMFSFGLAMWNLSKGGSMDYFAIFQFGVAGFCFWMYWNLSKRYSNVKEKTWRSYKKRHGDPTNE